MLQTRILTLAVMMEILEILFLTMKFHNYTYKYISKTGHIGQRWSHWGQWAGSHDSPWVVGGREELSEVSSMGSEEGGT